MTQRSSAHRCSIWITAIPLALVGTAATTQAAWIDRNPTAKPAARVHTHMVFDAARDITLFFGGSDPVSGVHGDTWEYGSVHNAAWQPQGGR